MSVNLPSRQELDAQIKTVLPAVRTALDNVTALNALIVQIGDTKLTTTGQGYEYAAQDLTDLKAALVDLDKLRQIADAQATQPAANDFFFNAKKVWGFNPVRR
jgi:hypothetical protein